MGDHQPHIKLFVNVASMVTFKVFAVLESLHEQLGENGRKIITLNKTVEIMEHERFSTDERGAS